MRKRARFMVNSIVGRKVIFLIRCDEMTTVTKVLNYQS